MAAGIPNPLLQFFFDDPSRLYKISNKWYQSHLDRIFDEEISFDFNQFWNKNFLPAAVLNNRRQYVRIIFFMI